MVPENDLAVGECGRLNDNAAKDFNVCVLGGDARQCYVAGILAQKGFTVSCYALPELPQVKGSGTAYRRASDIYSAICGAKVVVLPLPLSPDGESLSCVAAEPPSLSDVFRCAAESGCELIFAGAVKDRSKHLAEAEGVRLIDYGAAPELTVKNAVPTAEGAVEIAMRELKTTICGTRFAVIGYGRCGSALARLLSAMGGSVCGIARSAADRAKMYVDRIESYTLSQLVAAVSDAAVVFNTVPYQIFDCVTLAKLPKDTIIVDIASAPGGVDPNCAARYGIKAIHAASLPGKYAPRTAAEIICGYILSVLDGSAVPDRM